MKQSRARGGRASVPTTTPNEVQNTAVEELEGAKKGSGAPGGKGGAGPKKRQLMGQSVYRHGMCGPCVCSVSVSDSGCSDDQS